MALPRCNRCSTTSAWPAHGARSRVARWRQQPRAAVAGERHAAHPRRRRYAAACARLRPCAAAAEVAARRAAPRKMPRRRSQRRLQQPWLPPQRRADCRGTAARRRSRKARPCEGGGRAAEGAAVRAGVRAGTQHQGHISIAEREPRCHTSVPSPRSARHDASACARRVHAAANAGSPVGRYVRTASGGVCTQRLWMHTRWRPLCTAASLLLALRCTSAASCRDNVFSGLSADCNLNAGGSVGACCRRLAVIEPARCFCDADVVTAVLAAVGPDGVRFFVSFARANCNLTVTSGSACPPPPPPSPAPPSPAPPAAPQVVAPPRAPQQDAPPPPPLFQAPSPPVAGGARTLGDLVCDPAWALQRGFLCDAATATGLLALLGTAGPWTLFVPTCVLLQRCRLKKAQC